MTALATPIKEAQAGTMNLDVCVLKCTLISSAFVATYALSARHRVAQL
jgi:hypothetical protein